jgi:RNA recognition motif-containing protein
LQLDGTLEVSGQRLVIKRKSADADKVVSQNDGGVEPPSEGKGFQVFVGGLYSIARKAIKRHFAECGEIQSFEMPLTSDGESKGIAFITYKNIHALDKALDLNDTQLGKRWLTVERKFDKVDKQ